MQATSFPTQVNGFTWTPDGRWFVISSDVFPDCTDTACLEKTLKERADSPTKARIAERLLYRRWTTWKDGTRSHLWRVPARADGGRGRPDAGRPRRAALRGRRGNGLGRFAGRGGARLCVEPRQRRGPVDQRRPLPGQVLRRRAREERDGVEPRVRRFASLLARRKVDRLPRAEEAGFRGRPLSAHALRACDGPDPRPDRHVRLLGRGLSLDSGLEVDRLRRRGPRPAGAVSRAARGRGGQPVPLWTGGGVGGLEVAGSRVVYSASWLNRAAGNLGARPGRAPGGRGHAGQRRDLSGPRSRRGVRAVHDGFRRREAAGLARQAAELRSAEEVPRGLLHSRRAAGRLARLLVVPLESADLGGLRLRRLCAPIRAARRASARSSSTRSAATGGAWSTTI